jgi:hypothetical protein
VSSCLQVPSVVEEVDERSKYSLKISTGVSGQGRRSRFESLWNQRDHNSLDDYQTSEVFGSVNVVIVAALKRLERGSKNRMGKLGSRLTKRKANKDSV